MRPRMQFIAAALAVVAGMWAATPFAVAAAATKPATHTVVIDGTRFEPTTLTVKRGDTVAWLNKDPFPHTATAKGVFDSQNIAAGKSWRFKTGTAGEYGYICTWHPNMKGTLVVR